MDTIENVAVELDIRPVTGALGAEIHGVDLSGPLDETTRRAILDAFARYLVIWFPDQKLTRERHLEFSRMFGPLQPIPHIFSVEGYPDIQIVKRDAEEEGTYVVGGNLHTDSTYMETPPAAVIMHAIDVPEVGGDTMFQNMYLAWETLSPKLQEVLSGLNAVHSATWVFGTESRKRERGYIIRDMDEDYADAEIVHPVAPVHPVTGKRHLFVNKVYVRRFEGMTEEESKPLLDYLYQHCARVQFGCRARWRKNQVLVWDNRATMHQAVPDYLGQYRYLERTTVGGSRPAAA